MALGYFYSSQVISKTKFGNIRSSLNAEAGEEINAMPHGCIQQSTKDKTGNSVITFKKIGATGFVKKNCKRMAMQWPIDCCRKQMAMQWPINCCRASQNKL
jgi:hypothetical protein